MIPRPALAQWRAHAPWQTDLQIEQDLLLSVLAILVAQHPYLATRLAWRGGTCLHKLHLDKPWRYSEDLDYVLCDQDPDHGRVADALREVAGALGMDLHHSEVTSTRINVVADARATLGAERVRVKLEVNCADADPVLGLTRLPHAVATRWRSEHTELLTFQAPELVGTKFRALAQRRKGRDLSDLWLARRGLPIGDDTLAAAAHLYLAHERIEPAALRQQLALHTTDRDFMHDLDLLTATPYDRFDPMAVTHELIHWTDMHLDPLFDARRSASARARRTSERRRAAGPGDLRCSTHVYRNGNLGRCEQYYPPAGRCPQHPDGTPVVVP